MLGHGTPIPVSIEDCASVTSAVDGSCVLLRGSPGQVHCLHPGVAALNFEGAVHSALVVVSEGCGTLLILIAEAPDSTKVWGDALIESPVPVEATCISEGQCYLRAYSYLHSSWRLCSVTVGSDKVVKGSILPCSAAAVNLCSTVDRLGIVCGDTGAIQVWAVSFPKNAKKGGKELGAELVMQLQRELTLDQLAVSDRVPLALTPRYIVAGVGSSLDIHTLDADLHKPFVQYAGRSELELKSTAAGNPVDSEPVDYTGLGRQSIPIRRTDGSVGDVAAVEAVSATRFAVLTTDGKVFLVDALYPLRPNVCVELCYDGHVSLVAAVPTYFEVIFSSSGSSLALVDDKRTSVAVCLLDNHIWSSQLPRSQLASSFINDGALLEPTVRRHQVQLPVSQRLFCPSSVQSLTWVSPSHLLLSSSNGVELYSACTPREQT
eukprot:NODE_410_length_1535_cov_113.122159_g378_i0.p1 GENE.NODE_410_length_1535_cov_113.122159_g378_i0~~NODE_410_length_1535_cov_113.122159_g378_i0.p1  ORF type:complete len:434 (-),score=42.54 NODE_410_length_1535_cov_113.122159_g378_i0:184-1485(-)